MFHVKRVATSYFFKLSIIFQILLIKQYVYVFQFREELVPIYRQLRRLCEDLRRRKDNFSSTDSGISHSPEEIRASEIRLGMLTAVTKELGHLIEEAFLSQDDSVSKYFCLACQNMT